MRNSILVLAMVLAGAILISGCTSPNPGTATPIPTTTVSQPPSPGQLITDMAALDQAYIPVLALTTQNDTAGSRKSMDTLLTKWGAFKGTYYAAMPQDSLWKPNLDTVDMTITTANARIVEGNLSGAHAELEQFRLTMLDLRTRNNIGSFIDKLTLFHGPMETIVLAAADKAPADVDVATIRQAYPDAVAKWNAVKSGTIDTTLYGFTPDQLQKTRVLIANQTAAMDKLGAALDSGNTSTIGTTAVAIKGPFSILFSSFGKFPA